MPLISVLMPVWNGLEYLPKAVDSILGQSIRDLELIIVDDGSTEPVGEYVTGLSDKRIVYKRLSENIGLTKALNIAIDLSSGGYIARQDGDDWSYPRRFEKQLMWSVPGVGLVVTWARCVDVNGRYMADHYFDAETRIPETEIAQTLLSGNCIVSGTGLWPREAMRTIGYYDEELWFAQDYNYWLRLTKLFEVRVVPQILYNHRRWPGSRRKTQADRTAVNGLELNQLCRDRALAFPYIERPQGCL